MKRFAVPYGLLAVLGVYAAGVWLYVWHTYWDSDAYRAAEHYQAAEELVAPDDGKTASKEKLTQAYVHYLEAARLMPRITFLHKRIEAMRWRFDERGFKLEKDLQMRAEAVAVLWSRIQQEQEPLFVVGRRDRGWNTEDLLAGPAEAFAWSLPGLVGVIGVWALMRFSSKRVREREHEAELKKLEAEVVARGAQRKPPPIRK